MTVDIRIAHFERVRAPSVMHTVLNSAEKGEIVLFFANNIVPEGLLIALVLEPLIRDFVGKWFRHQE